jgi:hypothetical protein
MSWATVTSADFILEGFNASERTAVQTAAGGDDGLDEILASAIAEFRAAINAADVAMDDDATTVPPNVRRHLIALARWQLLIKFPSLKSMQTEARQAAADRAEDILQAIAKGELPVEPAEEDTTLDGGASGGQVRIAMTTDNAERFEP